MDWRRQATHQSRLLHPVSMVESVEEYCMIWKHFLFFGGRGFRPLSTLSLIRSFSSKRQSFREVHRCTDIWNLGIPRRPDSRKVQSGVGSTTPSHIKSCECMRSWQWKARAVGHHKKHLPVLCTHKGVQHAIIRHTNPCYPRSALNLRASSYGFHSCRSGPRASRESQTIRKLRFRKQPVQLCKHLQGGTLLWLATYLYWCVIRFKHQSNFFAHDVLLVNLTVAGTWQV